MAAKSIIKPYKAIAAGDMSADIVQTKDGVSSFSGIKTQDNMSYQVKWSGVSPVGEIIVEVSNDDLDNLNNVATAQWTRLNFGSTVLISGNTGDHLLNINQNPGAYMRIRYARTSGTGTLNCTLVSKSLGGV